MKLPVNCRDVEQDLLLHGLGELPYWRSWMVSLHLSGCGQCRSAQEEMLAVSRRMARALAPSGGRPRLARPAVTVAQGWLALASAAIVIAFLILAGSVAVVRYRVVRAQLTAQQDVPCRPDLPNDKCR